MSSDALETASMKQEKGPEEVKEEFSPFQEQVKKEEESPYHELDANVTEELAGNVTEDVTDQSNGTECKSKKGQPWWNKELQKQRKKTRRLMRQALKKNDIQSWDAYRAARNAYSRLREKTGRNWNWKQNTAETNFSE